MNGVVVADNGAGALKIGLSTAAEPTTSPNCVAKSRKDRSVWVGDALNECRRTHDLTYYRPHERGCVVNWDLERAIWDRFLSTVSPSAPPGGFGLVYTEPPLCPEPLRRNACQALFEELGFGALMCSTPQALALRHRLSSVAPEPLRRAAIVVDVGFSSSTVVPCACGNAGGNGSSQWVLPMAHGVRRVDVGGKVLTNLFKEAISFRHWNMMDEVALVNDVKERTAFVSLDLARDLRNPGSQHYLLPDYVDSTNGSVVTAEEAVKLKSSGGQILSLGNERFSVPEALFNPSDVGIEQRGIADAVAEAVSACNPGETDQLLSLVLVRGGSSLIKNFVQRLEAEVRANTPAQAPVRIVASDDPIGDAWKGGKELVAHGVFSKLAVTRAEYNEYGIDHALRRLVTC